MNRNIRKQDQQLRLKEVPFRPDPVIPLFLEEPMKGALFKKLGYNIFEGYEEYEKGSVTELLYKRVNARFEYCCSQPFDEKNINKNNPDCPWRDGNRIE